ncbi:MAG: tetratricopeptide repeat protein, partial [Candidatus Electryoneaceae bacterium]|nr:tetratricopeptide repeat protein [Candidatus Electryoneaceae bacterium]
MSYNRTLILLMLTGVFLAFGVVTSYAQNPSAQAEREFSLALGDYRAGYYDRAAVSFNQYLIRYPDEERASQALYLMGESYYQAGDYQAAREAMERFINNYPFDQLADEAELRLGQVLMELERYSDAVRRLKGMATVYPESPLIPDAIYWAGEAASAAGDTSGAI